jgi:hypothetical protein
MIGREFCAIHGMNQQGLRMQRMCHVEALPPRIEGEENDVFCVRLYATSNK